MGKIEPSGDEQREIVASIGTFALLLVPRRKRVFDEHKSIPAHKAALQPLCNWASEAWVYELDPASEAYHAAGGILKRERGKFRIDLSGEPIVGHEYFWNASGGKRGTIVLLVPRDRIDWNTLFKASRDVFVFDNFLTGHSSAAIRLVRGAVAESDQVAFCFPRNNGVEWVDVYATPDYAVKVFDAARTLVPQRPIK